MNLFWKTIKLFTSGVMVILFILAIAVSSCNPKNSGSEETEQNAIEETEHPSDNAQEHPTDQEHPSDSTGSEEHPTN